MSFGDKKPEAEEHIRRAEKFLKTSFLKWTPDYDSAGDSFSKAATCFKVSKDHDRTLDALERACECYKQIRSLYHAAKMLEQAVLVCRDSGKDDKIADYAKRGGLLYRQHGSPESAAQLLEKAAKLLESKYPEISLTLYENAAETVTTEDRPKEASDYLAKAARLRCKVKDWEGAANSLRETIKIQQECGNTSSTGRLVAGLVLVQLARDDVVAANKVYSEFGGWCDSDVSPAMQTILQAFEDEDADAAREALRASTIKNLDVEFAKLAINDVPLPNVASLEQAAADFGARRAEAIEESPNVSNESQKELEKPKETDEEEDGLC